MLVLSRRQGESVIIGHNEIKVMVVGQKNGQVQIGFEAPREVSIHRQEIYEEIERERDEAAGDGPQEAA